MEATIGAFEHTAAAVQQSSWPEIEIKTRIIDFFKDLTNDGIVSSQLTPISWRRFADNVYQLVASYCKSNHAVPEKVDALLIERSASLRGPDAKPPPVSGTLFQMVVGHIAHAEHEGNLDNFVVVDSSELASLYGPIDPPRKFRFDLPEAEGE
jgi:hypothetical protein